MSFKTPSIAAEIQASSDQEIRNNFQLLQKLSKNFTSETEITLELDELIYENIMLNRNSNQPLVSSSSSNLPMAQPKKARSPKANGSSTNIELEEIKKGLLSIFQDLSDGNSGSSRGGSVNAQSITGKIGIDQLDDDLKKRLSSVSIIQYQLPNQPLSPKTAQSSIPAFQKIVDDVILGQNVFLVGGAGTGKTTLAQNVAGALGREYITINCSQWTAPTEIIGGQTLDGYQEGKLIEAWKEGYMLILDELPKIDPNTAGLFNDALAKTKLPNSLVFNSRKEKFEKHPNFCVIATGNIYPNTESMAYGANNKQDLSLLDRFAGSVYTIEKNVELEKSVVGSVTLWAWCNELRDTIESLKYESQISLRFMMTCRDTLLLEFSRMASVNSNISPNEGKTLKDCFESFIDINFTEVQQKTVRDRMRQTIFILNDFEYRKGSIKQDLVNQLVKSGYLASNNGLSGLGSVTRRYLME